MTEIITATFRDGAFVPEVQTNIPPGTRVRLVIEALDSNASNVDEALRKFDALCDSVSVTGGKRLSRQELHDRN